MHSDLWGPAPVESRGGKRYYIIFVADLLTFTFFRRRMKHFTPTKIMKPGLTPNLMFLSRFFIQIEKGSIQEKNLPFIVDPRYYLEIYSP